MPLPKLPLNSASIVVGPPLSGKKKLLYKYVLEKTKNKEPVIFLSTDRAPEEIKKELVKNKIFYGRGLRFIDCYSHQTGNMIPDREDEKRVAGPLALNEISIALAEIERSFLKENKTNHLIIFDSLSTILMYSNAEAVSRFIQVLIGKIKSREGSIMFTIEEGMHDQKTVITIQHLMDVIINLKKEDEKIMIKVQGIEGFGDWKELQ